MRLQLLQEDGSSSDQVIDQLENSDLRAGVYEGGFKTWECSIDLASLLLDRGPRKDIDELVRCDQVVEVSFPSMPWCCCHADNDLSWVQGVPCLPLSSSAMLCRMQ